MARGASLDLIATLPGLATVSTGLTRLSVSIADWTPFWVESFAPFFYRNETEMFASGGTGRSSWASLSPQYAKWKVKRGLSGSILVQTGALKASLTSGGPGSIFQPSATALAIGSGLPYAHAHFTGTPKGSRGPKSLPKRREIQIPWQFLAATAPYLKKWIRDQAAKEALPGLEIPAGDAP
jgi:phage gpG-like protein